MFLLNGEPADCIQFADRGFQYGDGLFETIAIERAKPLFLDQHLRRLEKGCERLLIPTPDLDLLRIESRQSAAISERAVLKLIVTRGVGGRGYKQPDFIKPTRLVSLHPYPDYPDIWRTDGVSIRYCHQPLAVNPSLAGIKHMNRLEQILARSEWFDDRIQEGLMLDTQGRVIEGTMTNLFIVQSGKLLTPDLKDCGILGIVRGLLIDLAKKLGYTVAEAELDVSDIDNAEEVFVCNSIIGIWPVSSIEQRAYAVGPITRTLIDAYEAAKVEELSKW